MTIHTLRGTIEAAAPFDFAKSLSFVCSFPPTAGEQRIDARSLTKAMRCRRRTIAFELAQADGASSSLAYALHAASPIDPATQREAIGRIRFQLGLDDDLRPFYALARQDRAFSPVARRLHGFHHPKFPSPFEIAVWAVLGQRTPIAVARRTKAAIVARWGSALDVGDATYRAFPDAEALAAVPEAELREVVRDPRRAAAIAAIARAFCEVDEAFLREGPFEEVESWLRALPRIGEWSSAFVLFRGLGRMPRMSIRGGPIADAARRVYGQALTDREVVAIADRYGEYCGYWSLYLRAGS